MATAAPPTGPRIAGALLAVVFLAILVLVFLGTYLAIPDHNVGFTTLGVLALILALVSYLAQAFSAQPTVQRTVAWGLGAGGFALLFLTVWFVPPSGGANLGDQILASVVLLILLAVTIGLAWWRSRDMAQRGQRQEHREAWAQTTPPSAFDYAAANSPGTGTVGTPPPPTQGGR